MLVTKRFPCEMRTRNEFCFLPSKLAYRNFKREKTGIYDDVYHMQSEESHIGEALLDAGDMLINLHMADSNRGALGDGSIDLDTIIMALYLLNYNMDGKYVTPEPLGPGGNPYPAMYGKPDEEVLDRLVLETTNCFRGREDLMLSTV